MDAQNQNVVVKGRGWHGDPAGHAAAGRKGGEKVSQDRQHMAEIGRKGGQESGGNFANNRKRASEAGRKGGEASRGVRPQDGFLEPDSPGDAAKSS